MKKPTHFFDVRGGRFCSFFILSFFVQFCYAQKEFPPGAKSNGMAGAVCAMPDADHYLQAVSTSAFAEQAVVSSNYKNYYLLPQVYASTFSVVVPWKTLRIGAFAERFGPDHYKELRVGISAAQRIGHTALGLRLNWEQLAVEGFTTEHAFTGELGGIVALTSRLNFGANLYNFTLASFEHEILPVIMKCGLSGQVLSDLFLSAEVEKNINEPMNVKWGAQYTMTPSVKLLLGFTHPAYSLHGGLFFTYQSLNIAYSASWILQLGLSQEFTLSYTLKKKKNRGQRSVVSE